MTSNNQTKNFKTYQQQIDHLKNNKMLVIKDNNYAINLLKQYSYFGLISGYKTPFKLTNGNYKPHITIEDIYALYNFDSELRNILLKYILKVETHIKSLISYAFCNKHQEQDCEYLNATNYNYTHINQQGINDLIAKLNNIISNPNNYPYIKHQKNHYNNVPLWAMMKALTLGTVSKMYSFMKQSMQSDVSREFANVHEKMLEQMLDILSRFRNVCAHNERIYNFKYNKATIDNTNIHIKLGIPKKNNMYTKGKKDLFAVVITLKYLLNEEQFAKFCDELHNIIELLITNTKPLERSQLYKYMGFPNNWFDIKTLS